MWCIGSEKVGGGSKAHRGWCVGRNRLEVDGWCSLAYVTTLLTDPLYISACGLPRGQELEAPPPLKALTRDA